jgi:DNA-binding HxlR family transcriptional regulator
MIEKNLEKKHDPSKCVIRTVLDRFGDKWSILVLMVLGDKKKMRFNEINKYIDDISQKMLTVTLRSLEADGLVKRTIFPEIPPRVEYEITELGKSLVPHITNLATWAEENLTKISESRKKFGL